MGSGVGAGGDANGIWQVLKLKQEKHLQSERRIMSCIDHPFIVTL